MAISTLKHRCATAAASIAITAFTAAAATAVTLASAAPPTSTSPGAAPGTSSAAKSDLAPKATPTAPATIASVTARLTALSNRNEVLTENFNLAVVEVSTKQAQAEAGRVAARTSAAIYQTALDNVRLSLQAQYQEGNFPETSALLTSTSGQNYLDKSTALQQISTRRAGMATQLNRARLASVKASARLTQLLAAAKTKRDGLAVQRVTLAAQQKKYAQLLDQLNAKQQRAFLQPLSQGLTTKELASVGALSTPSSDGSSSQPPAGSTSSNSSPGTSPDATSSSTEPSSSTSSNGTSSNGTSSGTNSSGHKSSGTSTSNSSGSNSSGGGSSAPSSAAAIAVRYALAQLGKPYVYATSGPKTFDCSGLTAAAWRAAGKSIPHQSRLQSHLGHRVSKSQLEPGDLVFYYSPIHHVAIYIGKGLVVSAPQTGDVVKIVPVDHAGTYNMAVRL